MRTRMTQAFTTRLIWVLMVVDHPVPQRKWSMRLTWAMVATRLRRLRNSSKRKKLNNWRIFVSWMNGKRSRRRKKKKAPPKMTLSKRCALTRRAYDKISKTQETQARYPPPKDSRATNQLRNPTQQTTSKTWAWAAAEAKNLIFGRERRSKNHKKLTTPLKALIRISVPQTRNQLMIWRAIHALEKVLTSTTKTNLSLCQRVIKKWIRHFQPWKDWKLWSQWQISHLLHH